MNVIWGSILVVFTLILCWLSQVINALWPALAERLGLNERESEVDATFYADTRAEALWDAMVLWTLPVAGVLLLFNNPLWVYFGLVGGGMYLYFTGRGICARLVMQRRGIRIGTPGSLRLYIAFLILCGLIAGITIILAMGTYAA